MFKRTIKITKEVFTNPSDFFESVRREKSINNVLFFFLVLTLFYILVTVPSMVIQNIVLTDLVGVAPLLFGALAAIFYAVMMFIVSFITLFIFAAILHIGVYFMKGKGGIRETIKAYGYSQAPSFVFGGIIAYLMLNEVTALFGLVPIVIIAVWTIVLTIIGIQKLHNLTLGKSILAFLISIAVTFLIGILFVLLMLLIAASAGTIPI